MAWTSPRTWVAGETVTAALLNTHVRDNLKAIGDPWTTYGSGSSWTASGSNPSLGNGTWNGAYMQAGKLVHFRVIVTMGSTTTYGSGNWRLALPVTPVNLRWIFQMDLLDNGTAQRSGRAIWNNPGGYCDIYTPDTTAGNGDRTVTSTVPHTWATTDSFSIVGTYEAA